MSEHREQAALIRWAQRAWIRQLTKQGFLAVVCHGWEPAKHLIIDYLCEGVSPAPPSPFSTPRSNAHD
jgi:hypothetical protein